MSDYRYGGRSYGLLGAYTMYRECKTCEGTGRVEADEDGWNTCPDCHGDGCVEELWMDE